MKKLAIVSIILAMSMMFPAVAHAAVNGTCEDDIPQDQNAQAWVDIQNGWTTSVYGELYGDTTRFQPCTNGFFYDQSNVTQWIAIIDPYSGSPNTIIQIGYLKCGYNNQSGMCSGTPGSFYYFWAYGHENNCELYPYQEVPNGKSLGLVPAGAVYHSFQITISRTDGYIRFYIDGNIQTLNYGGSNHTVLDPARVCWTSNSQTEASWNVERHDPNDGFGGVGYAWFQNTKYAHDLGALGANPTNWNSNYCNRSGNQSTEYSCSVASTTKVGFITTQQ